MNKDLDLTLQLAAKIGRLHGCAIKMRCAIDAHIEVFEMPEWTSDLLATLGETLDTMQKIDVTSTE